MRRAVLLLIPGLALLCLQRPDAQAACCYFSAIGQDVTQPAQKAFLTWDPQERIESFTVQPKFDGNAKDFGMVIPTPSQPRLYEMPRAFFKELGVFTILKPVPWERYRKPQPAATAGGFGAGGFGGGGLAGGAPQRSVTVVEAGVVGSLDYKIVVAEQARELYAWLKNNGYSYAGDEATLDHYITRRWFFTVMKIDPQQQKKRPDGTYSGEVTPTRFTFYSERLIYPLRITQISVPDETEALFYVQAPYKVDLPGRWSYQVSWTPMWRQALQMMIPEKATRQERAWEPIVESARPELERILQFEKKRDPRWQPSRLEWARKLTARDMGMLDGSVRFDRQADLSAVNQLRILNGHLKEGQWVTKLRKTFRRGEMSEDLAFTRALLLGNQDEMDYTYAMPTSPP
jgi:hypothetical protein